MLRVNGASVGLAVRRFELLKRLHRDVEARRPEVQRACRTDRTCERCNTLHYSELVRYLASYPVALTKCISQSLI